MPAVKRKEPSAPVKQVNFSLTPQVSEELDLIARRMGVTRSMFARLAIEAAVNRIQAFYQRPVEAGDQAASRSALEELRRIIDIATQPSSPTGTPPTSESEK